MKRAADPCDALEAGRIDADSSPYWARSAISVLESAGSTSSGLSAAEAARRLKRVGANRPAVSTGAETWRLGRRQVENPLMLLLVGAAIVSWSIRERSDAVIILVIVLATALVGFWQERSAGAAVRALLRLVAVRTLVRRDGRPVEVPVENIVPGDVVELSAGSVVPADARLLESNSLHVDEASLTGESFASEKLADAVRADAPLGERRSALFSGTHVVSGTATAVVVATGSDTEFGHVMQSLRLEPPMPDFERGLQKFGYMLVKVTAVLLLAIFALAAFRSHPVLESLMFALAIAVGMTPELLPAIVTINLARGARGMARHRVIVKRLSSIEDLGSMTVLCADKTGTLTEGVVHVAGSWAPDGQPSEDVLALAAVNAGLQAGLPSPIDDAIRALRPLAVGAWSKIGEVPYDFLRKRLSVLVEDAAGRRRLVTKGALAKVLDVCGHARIDGRLLPIADVRDSIEKLYAAWSADGQRVLGVAERELPGASRPDRADETGMTFAGFLTLSDIPKAGIADAIARLSRLGIELKIITGDNRRVAAALARKVGFASARVLAGDELRRLPEAAMAARAATTDVFAEVEPNQKERIILALKRSGAVVGFIGDGINDAPALHTADVGISVDSAVDVAKEAADVVLLQHDLHVLAEGVRQGRHTFANTLKYVYITTSANFGNMLSMALAVPFLPFLPLLPAQILLNNFLSDFPAMTIGGDRVDREVAAVPGGWDVGAIRRFMIVFGTISSAFDFLTFAVLLLVFRAAASQFRSGWFLVSLLTEIAILLVMRTHRPMFSSRPSMALLTTSIATSLLAVALVQLPPIALPLGFAPLPPAMLAAVIAITGGYVTVSEVAKRRFFRRTHPKRRPAR